MWNNIWYYFLDLIKPPTRRKKPMKFIPVESSSIGAISYDEETNMLAVMFSSNKSLYFYAGVPKDVYDKFIEAESKGSYLNAEIKGSYVYFKLEDVEIYPEGTTDALKVFYDKFFSTSLKV